MQCSLESATDYIDHWIRYQMRITRQPGCVIAIAQKGRLVFEKAYGYANTISREKLTPRHRFRVASHSKSITSTAILKLREEGKLHLDDSVGRYVSDLHPDIAAVTLLQLLSHGAGIIRDGDDARQWIDGRPFANEAELRSAFTKPPLVIPNTRMKYSNHGFGLLGLAIKSVTGRTYSEWITQNVLSPMKLDETTPDGPPDAKAPFAKGHSAEYPLGYRVIIPGDNATNALAPATGFISTAADMVKFFSSLDPDAEGSLLSADSRRIMLQKQWKDSHSSAVGYYGLGLCLGEIEDWTWAGHGGGFQSAKTFTAYLPGQNLCFSVFSNAIDGLGEAWADGVMRILKTFACNNPPKATEADWSGRWWTLGGAVDLIPFANKVFVALPGQMNPFDCVDVITLKDKNTGVVSISGGYRSAGEHAKLVRDGRGSVREVWLGGNRYVQEIRLRKEMKRRYEA